VVECIVAVHGARAAHAWVGCVALAEYRLDDLAEVSGVSARNIRAYRERGLLDPPRRVGRSAYYDDYHLSQLKTINQLLRKGFNSAHIAEFFASMRRGADLADILGIQEAVLGRSSEHPGEERGPKRSPSGVSERRSVDIDPDCGEAQKLVEYGLAEVVDGAVVLVAPSMGEIVARSTDHLFYIRAILRVFEATRATVDELATRFARALEGCVTSQFGPNYVPKPDDMGELSQLMHDYRDLGREVVAEHLDAALQRQMVTAVSDYTIGVLLSGQWDPEAR
jgi:DNA-binding transcriptional MerR regulator